MVKIKLLIDTDILIDSLKGIRDAKDLFRAKDIEISIVRYLARKNSFQRVGLGSLRGKE